MSAAKTLKKGQQIVTRNWCYKRFPQVLKSNQSKISNILGFPTGNMSETPAEIEMILSDTVQNKQVIIFGIVVLNLELPATGKETFQL